MLTQLRNAAFFGVMMVGVPGVSLAQDPKVDVQVSAASIHAYWTADKMANAHAKLPLAAGGPKPQSAPPQPTGPAGIAGGSILSSQGGAKFLQYPQQPPPALMRARTRAATPTPTDGSYPGPHATYEYGPRYRTFPVSTIGKLFFTEPGVGDFVCSAAVTTGSSSINNIVWTAGHCVAAGGQSKWYTNWLFCPSYDASQGGVNPAVGCWAGAFATTSNEWFAQGAFTRDYAIIGLAHSGSVIHADVATVTGGLGFAWNWDRDRQWMHLGYPQAAPFSGGKLIQTATEHRYDDTPDTLGPPTNSWGSSQTPGASGSPLVLYFNYTGAYEPNLGPGNWINSDVSYYYSSPNQYGFELQGPYFDTTVCSFWKSNTGFGGTC